MMNDETILKLAAMICISVVECIFLLVLHADGMGLMTYSNIISTIGGVGVAPVLLSGLGGLTVRRNVNESQGTTADHSVQPPAGTGPS